jgi:hypothetical protein
VTQQPVEWASGKLDFVSVSYYIASGDEALIVKNNTRSAAGPRQR